LPPKTGAEISVFRVRAASVQAALFEAATVSTPGAAASMTSLAGIEALEMEVVADFGSDANTAPKTASIVVLALQHVATAVVNEEEASAVGAVKQSFAVHFGGAEPVEMNFGDGHCQLGATWQEADPSHNRIFERLAAIGADVRQRGVHRGSSNLALTLQAGKCRRHS